MTNLITMPIDQNNNTGLIPVGLILKEEATKYRYINYVVHVILAAESISLEVLEEQLDQHVYPLERANYLDGLAWSQTTESLRRNPPLMEEMTKDDFISFLMDEIAPGYTRDHIIKAISSGKRKPMKPLELLKYLRSYESFNFRSGKDSRYRGGSHIHHFNDRYRRLTLQKLEDFFLLCDDYQMGLFVA